jgi:hypothetical protein
MNIECADTGIANRRWLPSVAPSSVGAACPILGVSYHDGGLSHMG